MLSLSWVTVTSVWMPKIPYRIFIWDTNNKNSGSFLSIPYLELFGSQRIQCDWLELLHSNHSDPTSMLPSLRRNNQEHTRDISLLQDVRFSQQSCWEFKSSAMWCVVWASCSGNFAGMQCFHLQSSNRTRKIKSSWGTYHLRYFKTLGTARLTAQHHNQRT